MSEVLAARRQSAVSCARDLTDIERFDPQPVARQHHTPGVALVHRKGEHAVEPLDGGRAPGVIGLEDRFRVAVGKELVAQPCQLLPQFAIVIDAAIERDAEPSFASTMGCRPLAEDR